MATPPTPIGRQGVSKAASDHRARLVSLRDGLTEKLDEAGPREYAPLAGQLRACLADLAALPDVTEASLDDDLRKRRAARRAASAG